MSTTVTYKGNTLTTVDNQTRTLLTSGKYMEDDITLVDISGGGGGQTVRIDDGAGMFSDTCWVDGDGVFHTSMEVDMDTGMFYMEPQIGTMATLLSAIQPQYTLSHLQQIKSSSAGRPPSYWYVWEVV